MSKPNRCRSQLFRVRSVNTISLVQEGGVRRTTDISEHILKSVSSSEVVKNLIFFMQ